jgi:Uma2 family endonuclease
MGITIEQFEDRLAEGDRWIELRDGQLIRHDPPDESHGDVIRNLARPLAQVAATMPDLSICFELPVVISRQEQTVRCPAVSCFQSVNRFEETDKLLTDSCPALVIEVASTNDRRAGMTDRVTEYLDCGVVGVWVIDPVSRQVHQFVTGRAVTKLGEQDVLNGAPLLPSLSVPVAELFRPPNWLK